MARSNGRWVSVASVLGLLSAHTPLFAETGKPAAPKAATLAAAAAVPAGSPAPPVVAPPKKKLGPAPDKQTSAKVNAYIEVLNGESEHVFSERDRWYQAIDPKLGPTCKEKNISFEQIVGPDGGRFDAYRKKLKAKPALAPDAAALRMVDAAEELRNIGKRPGPHNEYQARGKPEAWCKELKEAFPLLVAAFDKYGEANREVRDYVDDFTDERDQRELETTLKKYGKHYRHRFAALVLQGKVMMRGVRAELGKEQPDAAVVKRHFSAYLALADDAKATMDTEPPKQKTEPYPQVFRFFLIESIPKLKRASEELLTTLAQKPEKQRDQRLDKNWDAVVASYNDVIGYMNQVQFEQKQK
ncbi:MAG: DUF3829 domain-containing protein [Polyangiaceae bacterium]